MSCLLVDSFASLSPQEHELFLLPPQSSKMCCCSLKPLLWEVSVRTPITSRQQAEQDAKLQHPGCLKQVPGGLQDQEIVLFEEGDLQLHSPDSPGVTSQPQKRVSGDSCINAAWTIQESLQELGEDLGPQNALPLPPPRSLVPRLGIASA